MLTTPNGRSTRLMRGVKTRGWRPMIVTSASASSGITGAELKPTVVRLMKKTSTPASAESPASITIEPRMSGVSRTPKRRIAATRAAGIQTEPGTYLARIDVISACRATM